jgi:hypothetical protein
MADYFATGTYREASQADRFRLLLEFYRRLLVSEDPETLGKMKQFASRFTHGVVGGAALRRAVYASRTAAEVIEQVEGFFAGLERTDESSQVMTPQAAGLAACTAAD